MKRRFAVIASLLIFALLPSFAVKAQNRDATCTPGISFWSLLGSVGVSYVGGHLHLSRLYAVCLPTPSQTSHSNYPYDPDGGGKLTTVIKNSEGKSLGTLVWYAESIGGLWELSNYKVLGGAESLRPLTAGSYVLEFAADGKLFYKFPFSVAEGKNDDPYQPAGTRYFIEGAWNEYGNLFYQRNDPQSTFRFTTWLQQKIGHESKESVPYDAKLVRVRDGKVIGQDSATLKLQPRWLQADFFFQDADADKNSRLNAAALLREDGKYVVRLTIEGKPYGEYSFVVKGGRIQFQGKQIREATESTTYIVDYLSGGRYSSWWIPRSAR
jgi:hypothetical protein